MLTEIEVAIKLLQINAIRLDLKNPFTWASGLKSPIYCDNRRILSFPNIRNFVKSELAQRGKELGSFDKVAGVATAGIAHGALLADELGEPFIYVRSGAKKHGTRNQIEGVLNEGDRCLVVEDLISTGGSSIQAVEVLRSAGAVVTGVIAIFSYELDSARANFEKAGCPFTTLSNYSALIKAVHDSGYLGDEDIQRLIEWKTNPQKWSELYGN